MLKKISIKKMKPVLGLILFSVAITIIRPNFMTSANLLNVLRQTSINAIIAAGMTFVILTGGIDLSVGSILAFSSAVGVWMLQTGNGIAVSVLVCLVIGALAGLFNSVVITRGNIQPFIATLATIGNFFFQRCDKFKQFMYFSKNRIRKSIRNSYPDYHYDCSIFIMLAYFKKYGNWKIHLCNWRERRSC